MYVLDTNVISELRKGPLGHADEHVMRWAQSVDADLLYLSAISILELEIGALRIERRDKVQGSIVRKWLERVVFPEFKDRILVIDMAAALQCAPFHVPDPRPERDALIASSALRYNMTVVTRNTKDFEGMGLTLLNPWIAR
jgi:toxin FitB